MQTVIYWVLVASRPAVNRSSIFNLIASPTIHVKLKVTIYCNIVISKFSFMLVEIFVHMSLLNMLIYIDVLCVPVTIYFNGLKYLSHLSWINMSDIYLTCLAFNCLKLHFSFLDWMLNTVHVYLTSITMLI